MKHIQLAAGIARDGDRILLVASRYPSHERPLWNLPGGRWEPSELLAETVVREVREETSLDARVLGLAYVSESYDEEAHFLNIIFEIAVRGTIALPVDDHVVAVEWCPLDALEERLEVTVIREPLLAYLRDGTRYAARKAAGITIRWNEE